MLNADEALALFGMKENPTGIGCHPIQMPPLPISAVRAVIRTPIRRDIAAEIKAKVRIEDTVRADGHELKPQGKSLVGLCPFHAENTPSFNVNVEGQYFKCFGCGAGGDVLEYVRLKLGKSADGPGFVDVLREGCLRARIAYPGDSSAPRTAPSKLAAKVTTPKKIYIALDNVRKSCLWQAEQNGETLVEFNEYEHPDSGTVELVTVRFEKIDESGRVKKRFMQIRSCEGGFCFGGLERNPLFNRADVRDVGTIVVVEGEKCARALMALGIVATTSPGGASAVQKADWGPLVGKDVVIWPDADQPGTGYARDVISALNRLNPAPSVFLVDVSSMGLPAGGDVVDFLAHIDGDSEAKSAAVMDVICGARPSECVSDPEPTAPGDERETMSAEDMSRVQAHAATPAGNEVESNDGTTEMNWPSPLGFDAYHGLAGVIVRTIEPHSEADPAALLIQFLAAFGNYIGRGCHWKAEGDQHHANLFTVLVGRSGKGRKGTSWGQIRRLFDHIGDWAKERIKSGLSSGEGMIWAVRDPVIKTDTETGEPEIEDAGVTDKRLMLNEPEFAQVLKQTERTGNTLSPLIRQAWDRGDLESLTKNSPAKATGAHISIVGHVTKNELLRYLTSTESGNGFANRFLWVCVSRSKELPDGGNLSDAELAVLRGLLQPVLDAARDRPRLLMRDADAKVLWRSVYGKLTAEREGLAAAVCGRAEAQTMRLAMLYALLDGSDEIRVEHLKAGLAVWRYCEESALCIFGSSCPATIIPPADDN